VHVDLCEHCVFGKYKRVNFSPVIHNPKNILDVVHTDLWGHSRDTSHDGARYMLTIIDHSPKVWPYFLKHKSDAFESFKAWKVMVEKQTKR
jgi:hypothetical protein